MTTTRAQTAPLMIVACSAAKADHPAPAADLYRGSLFTMNLAAARAESPRVMILSAKHGLVPAEQVVAPYDTTLGDVDAITARDLAAQFDALPSDTLEAWFFGPGAYARMAAAAGEAVGVSVHHVNEADAGVGYMRRTARVVATVQV